MRDWIKIDLAPALNKLKLADERFQSLKLMIHDDVRIFWKKVITVLDNKENKNAVDGVGLHWYRNSWL